MLAMRLSPSAMEGFSLAELMLMMLASWLSLRATGAGPSGESAEFNAVQLVITAFI